jgi:hypothetical protein
MRIQFTRYRPGSAMRKPKREKFSLNGKFEILWELCSFLLDEKGTERIKKIQYITHEANTRPQGFSGPRGVS